MYRAEDHRIMPCRAKRTQALVETTLPGIPRPTGVLRRLDASPASRYHRTPGVMPPKTQNADRFDGSGCNATSADRIRAFLHDGVVYFVSEIEGPFQDIQ